MIPVRWKWYSGDGRPAEGVEEAERTLEAVIPAAGHLVHMPGHIWLVLGDYETAATVNERAAQVDREYMQATGVEESAYAGYYIHNLHFIAAARGMQGRKAETMRAAEDIAGAVGPHAKAMPMMVDAFMPATLFAALRFNDWDAILNAPAPDPGLPATTAIWHCARASAYSARGRREEAARERAAFEEVRAWPATTPVPSLTGAAP